MFQSWNRIRARHLFAVVLLSGITALSGCQSTGGANKQTAGTLLGGASGALLGTQVGKGSGRIAAIIVGGLIGAGIGNQIGQHLDERDQALQAQATADALSTRGENVQPWVNPDGNSGAVRAGPSEPPRDTYYVECRTVSRTLDAQRNLTDQVQFCQQPDGRWAQVPA